MKAAVVLPNKLGAATDLDRAERGAGLLQVIVVKATSVDNRTRPKPRAPVSSKSGDRRRKTIKTLSRITKRRGARSFKRRVKALPDGPSVSLARMLMISDARAWTDGLAHEAALAARSAYLAVELRSCPAPSNGLAFLSAPHAEAGAGRGCARIWHGGSNAPSPTTRMAIRRSGRHGLP